MIGGDHLVALPPLKKALSQHPNLHVVHIDAHGDLREDWEGEAMSHATVLARALEHMSGEHRLIRWGIRSGPAREFELAAADRRRWRELRAGLDGDHDLADLGVVEHRHGHEPRRTRDLGAGRRVHLAGPRGGR